MNSTLLKPNAKQQCRKFLKALTRMNLTNNQIFLDFAIISFILVTLMFD